MVVAPNYMSEIDIIKRIGEHAENNHKVNNTIMTRSAYSIIFSNGSEIHTLYNKPKKKIDVFFISEMAYIPMNIYKELHELYEIHKPSKVIVDSTPHDYLFKTFVNKNENKLNKGIIFISYNDVEWLRSKPNYVNNMKKSLTKEEFEREILGKL